MGYAIAAAVETGDPVVAIEGDSAFGFSGMDLETICRYNLPVVVVILRLADFEIPERISFAEKLPLTAKGSVNRAKVAEQFTP